MKDVNPQRIKNKESCCVLCVFMPVLAIYMHHLKKSTQRLLYNSLAMTSLAKDSTKQAKPSPSSCRFRSQIPPTRLTCSGTASLWSTCTSWMRSTTLTGQIQSCSRRENRPWRRPGTSLLMSDRTEKRGTDESKEGG